MSTQTAHAATEKENAAVISASGIGVRGVWHRPNDTGTETNLAGLRAVLDTFRKTGINLVFLETFYHGMTVFRTSTVPYNTGLDAYDYSPYPDYLTAFVAEARKRGIEVHAWVEDFYVGVTDNYFTRFLPEWMMLTRDGSIRQSEGRESGGYLFLDPANPEVRQYLVRFYDELLTAVPGLAGLNLDYIRYPLSGKTDDTGYTETAMNGFAVLAGITFPEGATREQKTQAVAARYTDWVNYRAAQVTTFVGEVFDMVRERHPEALLSTAVFPEQGKSFEDKKQDFSTWLSSGYLDILTPMAYYDDTATLKRALGAMLPDLADCFCYAGISATYHNLPDARVLEQMAATREAGADGYVFFGSKSILGNEQYIRLLSNATNAGNLRLTLPHAGVGALAATTASVVAEKLRQAGEEESRISALTAELTKLCQTQDRDAEQLSAAKKQLRLLVKYNLASYLSDAGVNAVRDDLETLYRYLTVEEERALKRPASSTDDGDDDDGNGDSAGGGTAPTPTDPDRTAETGGTAEALRAFGIAAGATATVALGITAVTRHVTKKRKKDR